jgi:DNA-binding beta-propeller fold protein YncE
VLPALPSYERGGAARSLVSAGTGSAGNADGPALSAQFNEPAGIAVGPDGTLYVCDTGNNLVRKISGDGTVSTLLGAALGTGLRLSCPTGIAVDARGNVFVCDTGNSRIVIIAPDGTADVYAGHGRHQGFADAPDRANARFNLPRGLTIDAAGALYVADFRNDRIRRIDAAGVTTVVSHAGGPTAVAIGPDGTLYYVATWSASIVSVSPSGEQRVLANPAQVYGDKSGPGAQAALRPADGLVFTENALLFCDTGNNRVRSVAFDERNTVSTLLGSGRAGSGIGFGSDTELIMPRGLAATGDGGYLVADALNHRILYFSTASRPANIP